MISDTNLIFCFCAPEISETAKLCILAHLHLAVYSLHWFLIWPKFIRIYIVELYWPLPEYEVQKPRHC